MAALGRRGREGSWCPRGGWEGSWRGKDLPPSLLPSTVLPSFRHKQLESPPYFLLLLLSGVEFPVDELSELNSAPLRVLGVGGRRLNQHLFLANAGNTL